MAFSAGKGIIDLTVNTKGLRRGLPGIGKAFIGLGAAAAGAGLAVAKLTGFLKDAMKLSFEQAKAEAKLGAVLRSTGYAAGFSTEQLKEQARSFQAVSVYGDETILSMQAVLATFKEVKGDNFTRASKAVLDMATVLDTDLKSAAIQVGKALNDPVGQLGALGKAGIILTDQQKKLIKEMVETNRIADAQAVILGELESEFGKAADAVGNTFGGQVKKLQNIFGDLKEEIAGKIEPEFAKFLQTVKDNVEGIKDLAFAITEELVGGINDLAGGMTDVVVEGDAAAVAIKTLTGWVKTFRLEMKIIGLELDKWKKRFSMVPSIRIYDWLFGTAPKIKDIDEADRQIAALEDKIQTVFANTVTLPAAPVPSIKAPTEIPGFRGSASSVEYVLKMIEANTRKTSQQRPPSPYNYDPFVVG